MKKIYLLFAMLTLMVSGAWATELVSGKTYSIYDEAVSSYWTTSGVSSGSNVVFNATTPTKFVATQQTSGKWTLTEAEDSKRPLGVSSWNFVVSTTAVEMTVAYAGDYVTLYQNSGSYTGYIGGQSGKSKVYNNNGSAVNLTFTPYLRVAYKYVTEAGGEAIATQYSDCLSAGDTYPEVPELENYTITDKTAAPTGTVDASAVSAADPTVEIIVKLAKDIYTVNYKCGDILLATATQSVDPGAAAPTADTKTWFGVTAGTQTVEGFVITVPYTNNFAGKTWNIYTKASDDTKCYMNLVSTNSTPLGLRAQNEATKFELAPMSTDANGIQWSLKNADTESEYLASYRWDSKVSETAFAWTVIGTEKDGVYFYQFGADKGNGYIGLESTSDSPTTSYSKIYCNKTYSGANPAGSAEASALKFFFEEYVAPAAVYTIKYNLYYGETKVGDTQTFENVAVNAQYPTPTMPAFASIESGMPTGTVQADGEYDIKIKYTMPFEYAADAASISKWYTMKMHATDGYGKYIYNNGEGEKILGTAEVPTVNTSYLWGFIGDPLNGFSVISYGTEGKGVTNDNPCQVGTAATFTVYNSTAADGWFALYDATTDNHFLNWHWNSQDIVRWSAADAGSSIYVEEAEPVEAVTANMNIRATLGCATFCAPFDVTIPEGVKACKTEDAGTWVKLNEITDGTIPAETPVVLICENDFEQNFTGAPSANTTCSDGVLTGVLDKLTAVPTGKYVLQNQTKGTGWYKVETNDINCGVNRCYMNELASGARAFVPMAFDETTGISSVATEAKTKADGKYLVNGRVLVVKAGKAYNLNGQIVK